MSQKNKKIYKNVDVVITPVDKTQIGEKIAKPTNNARINTSKINVGIKNLENKIKEFNETTEEGKVEYVNAYKEKNQDVLEYADEKTKENLEKAAMEYYRNSEEYKKNLENQKELEKSKEKLLKVEKIAVKRDEWITRYENIKKEIKRREQQENNNKAIVNKKNKIKNIREEIKKLYEEEIQAKDSSKYIEAQEKLEKREKLEGNLNKEETLLNKYEANSVSVDGFENMTDDRLYKETLICCMNVSRANAIIGMFLEEKINDEWELVQENLDKNNKEIRQYNGYEDVEQVDFYKNIFDGEKKEIEEEQPEEVEPVMTLEELGAELETDEYIEKDTQVDEVLENMEDLKKENNIDPEKDLKENNTEKDNTVGEVLEYVENSKKEKNIVLEKDFEEKLEISINEKTGDAIVRFNGTEKIIKKNEIKEYKKSDNYNKKIKNLDRYSISKRHIEPIVMKIFEKNLEKQENYLKALEEPEKKFEFDLIRDKSELNLFERIFKSKNIPFLNTRLSKELKAGMQIKGAFRQKNQKRFKNQEEVKKLNEGDAELLKDKNNKEKIMQDFEKNIGKVKNKTEKVKNTFKNKFKFKFNENDKNEENKENKENKEELVILDFSKEGNKNNNEIKTQVQQDKDLGDER